MNDHVLALLYLLLCNVMIVLYHVEKLAGQGLFARMTTLIAAAFFLVTAVLVIINTWLVPTCLPCD